MIDSSRSPVPAWKRYLTMTVMIVLVVVAGWVLYTKEIHHSAPGSSSSPAVTNPAPSTTVAQTPVTTVPGGIAPSARDPFSG